MVLERADIGTEMSSCEAKCFVLDNFVQLLVLFYRIQLSAFEARKQLGAVRSPQAAAAHAQQSNLWRFIFTLRKAPGSTFR